MKHITPTSWIIATVFAVTCTLGNSSIVRAVDSADTVKAKAEQAAIERERAERARLERERRDRELSEKVEQNRLEQARIREQQDRNNQARMEQERAQQLADQQERAERSRIEREKGDKLRADRSKAEQAYKDKVKADRARTEQTKSGTAVDDEWAPAPKKPQSEVSDTTKVDGAKTDGTKPDGTKIDGVKTDGTKPDGDASKSISDPEKKPERRIEFPIKNGSLTTYEIRMLERQQKDIATLETSFPGDGKITKDETRQLQNMLNSTSRNIWGEKYDSLGKQAPTYRLGDNVFAKDDIVKKIADSSLSNEDARKITQDFKHILDVKHSLATDDLSSDQRTQKQNEYNDLLNQYFEIRTK